MTVFPPVVAKQQNTQKNKFSYSKAAPEVAAQKFKQSTRRARRLFPAWLAAEWMQSFRLLVHTAFLQAPGVCPCPSTQVRINPPGVSPQGLKSRAAGSWTLWMHQKHSASTRKRGTPCWKQRSELLKVLRQTLVISPLDAGRDGHHHSSHAFPLIHPQSTPGNIKHLSQKGKGSQNGLGWKDFRDDAIPPWFTRTDPAGAGYDTGDL